jgi:hypothetical protein
MIRYLNDGEDFGPSHFAECGNFTKSAAGSDTNQSNAVSMPMGVKKAANDKSLVSGKQHGYRTDTRQPLADGGKAMAEGAPLKVNPWNGKTDAGMVVRVPETDDANEIRAKRPDTDEVGMRKGGRIKRADGGEAGPDNNLQEDRGWQDRALANDYRRRADELQANSTRANNQKSGGGRIKRAIGGVIPGQAPAPVNQPLTRNPVAAPNSPGGPGTDGGLLKNATVSMPAGDMAQLASGAVKMGARAALGAVAARSRRPGPPMPGAAATAPMAASPALAAQKIPGGMNMQPGMKGGGRVKRAMGGPMGGMPGNPMNGGMVGSAMGAAPMGAGVARPMPTTGGAPGAMPTSVPMGVQMPMPMAKGGRLTAATRQSMPKSQFALPGKGDGPKGAGSGSYPIPDKKHARLALAMDHNASPAERKTIERKVHARYPNIGKG